MTDADREALHLIGGPFDGGQVQLTETPLHIDIDGVRYKRLDDPNTGEFLGAYGMSHEEQVETSARIMTGERDQRSEEHTSELQSRGHLVCRLLLEKKNEQA